MLEGLIHPNHQQHRTHFQGEHIDGELPLALGTQDLGGQDRITDAEDQPPALGKEVVGKLPLHRHAATPTSVDLEPNYEVLRSCQRRSEP